MLTSCPQIKPDGTVSLAQKEPLELKPDACCLSETLLQDPNTIITLRSPHTISFFRNTLRVSGGPASNARGQTGAGVTERTLLGWILVTSHRCVVRLDDSVGINDDN